MRNCILLALAGTSLIVLAMLSIQRSMQAKVVEGAIVPEFPSIALLIVVGALAPIIVMTRLRKNASKIDA